MCPRGAVVAALLVVGAAGGGGSTVRIEGGLVNSAAKGAEAASVEATPAAAAQGHKETEDEHSVHHAQTLAMHVGLMLSLLTSAIILIQYLHGHHIHWLPESGATIIVGFLASLIIHTFSPQNDKWEKALYFNADFHNLFLLPPIVFESGFAVNQRLFIRNFGTISTFAAPGTLVAIMLTFGLITALGSAGVIVQFSTVDAGALASLISAVDPVATLVSGR